MLEKKLSKKKAAALSYDSKSDSAPIIKAYGKGVLAEKILEKAKEHNIPVYQNAALAEALENIDIGQEIPNELYEVVAEILIFISKMDANR